MGAFRSEGSVSTGDRSSSVKIAAVVASARTGGSSASAKSVAAAASARTGGISTCVMSAVAFICLHRKERSCCKECGGSSICAHGRIKYGCKACLQSAESTSKPQSSLTASSAPSVERDHALGKDTQLIELLGVADALELG